MSTVTGKHIHQTPHAGIWAATTAFGWRALVKLRRTPSSLVDVITMPTTSLLVFTYLIGGAVAGTPVDYLQYYLPGVLVMSAALATTQTGLNLNRDIAAGLFGRVRTMPVWRLSILTGTIVGDFARYTVALIAPLILGLILGFRPPGGVGGVLAAFLVLLAFSFSYAWIWLLVALVIRTPATASTLISMLQFVLIFCSNIFVPMQTMPGWLRAVVMLNPISHVSTLVRNLFDGTMTGAELWPVVGIFAGIMILFGSTTVYRLQRGR